MEKSIKRLNNTIVEIEVWPKKLKWINEEKSIATVKDRISNITIIQENEDGLFKKIILDEDMARHIFLHIKEIESRESRDEFWG